MSKKHERNELEHLRSIIRSQKSQIKNLHKEIKRASKRQHQYEEFEQQIQDVEYEEVATSVIIKAIKENCPECKSTVTITDLGSRKLLKCNSCEYRKTKKA